MDLTPLTPQARYDLAHTAHVAAYAHYETVSTELAALTARHTEAGWALDEADRILREARELLLEADPTALPDEGEPA